ncbi:MAG: beta-galactosidase [Candidatus Limivivens sp.]|nr:beta-galactosidase [Candidatus Limivivens sp.]
MKDAESAEKMKNVIEKICFGVDYYPEHWPEERWETDAELMEKMGIQMVRMAEFSWHKMEPRQGEFCFQWLDHAIELLGKHGIYTVLGTPTAAPPAWMIEKNPEILPVDSQGQRKSFGGRHHDCQSNDVYRKHVRRLVSAMAEHFKDNPYVIAWQIDNELGNSHGDLCMCENCRKGFSQWLRKKYKTIENLNQEWGTAFWSQEYDSFSQIPTPRQTPTVHNPSLMLDWKRFCSDLVIDFQKMQIEIIRSIAPHQKITHNLMGFYDKTDYFKMAEDLDFASNDQYPTGYYFDAPGQPPYEVAACMDFIRCVKQKNFWMMEMESGPTGGNVIGANPRPGQNRLWTAQSVAHGADEITYFRWRTCLFGAEQFWHGILPHDGKPGRRYQEIQDTIQMLMPVMEDIHGIVQKADVGILFSYDEEWAIRLQPQNPGLTYEKMVLKFYKEFYERNIGVDFVSVQRDYSDYKILVAPLLYLMTPELEEKLTEYVKGGGTLILTMRTGVMNENNVCMSHRPLPGNLSEIVGAEVEEYDSLYGKKAVIAMEDAAGYAEHWCDILSLKGASPLMYYMSEFYKGKPAVTVNSAGCGCVYYIGTDPEERMLECLMDKILKKKGMFRKKTGNVEVVKREGREKDYLFLMNHGENAVETEVPEGWSQEGHILLEEYGVKILERKHKDGEAGLTESPVICL